MKVVHTVLLESIHFDTLPINESVLNLVFFIMSGGEVPPIKLQNSALGGYTVKDGRHRICAYKLLGKKHIKAKFHFIEHSG
jgi:hypothetical protein